MELLDGRLGDTTVGNIPYVDVNGNILSLALNVTNGQAGGYDTVTIQGRLRITAPRQTPIYEQRVEDAHAGMLKTIPTVTEYGGLRGISRSHRHYSRSERQHMV